MSLSRKQRLRKSADYQRLRQSGKWIPGRYLHLQVMKREQNDAFSRLGLAVSRRIGSAVVRNKVRRRLREVFRVISPEFSETIDVVVIARKGIESLEFAELNNCLRHSLRTWLPSRTD